MERTLRRIREATTRRDLWSIMLDHFRSRGVAMVSYHATDASGRVAAIATDGFPQDWVCRYIEEDLVKIDPIPVLASTLARAFHWHEIHDLVPLTDKNRSYLDAMEAAKLGDGLAFYVFGPNLQNAYVGLGFGVPRVDLSAHEVFEHQCVAQAGHLRFCDLSRDRKTVSALSERETEVLEWMAQGKSNSVIAQILGLSPHTIDTHVRSIYAKLDVADRTSAALRGLGRGLISIP